jgi:UDP-galactopyranose mutase
VSSPDVLVVGAGFAGSVMAERLAAAGRRVLVIDRREHIAGNAYDERDAHGVLIHRYGPHIFHTNSEKVFDYPVPRPENRALYERYAQLAAAERGVTFVGRLARYQYLNMDQVVAQALAAFAGMREPTYV